jgi:hypothetical protein
MGERLNGIQEVGGSIPPGSTSRQLPGFCVNDPDTGSHRILPDLSRRFSLQPMIIGPPKNALLVKMMKFTS